MVTLTKIGVMSLAKIYGFLCAILGAFIGLIFGLIFIFGGAIGGAISGNEGAGIVLGIVLGLLFFFGAIFLYGAMGFIMGAITAFGFNFAAKKLGGLEFEIAPVKKTKK